MRSLTTLNDNPSVSVVMPVYIVAVCVMAAVMSIFLQSYADLELIVAYDDGLNGSTLEHLSQVENPRLPLVHSQHRGFLASMNEAIRQARGQWIARIVAPAQIDPGSRLA